MKLNESGILVTSRIPQEGGGAIVNPSFDEQGRINGGLFVDANDEITGHCDPCGPEGCKGTVAKNFTVETDGCKVTVSTAYNWYVMSAPVEELATKVAHVLNGLATFDEAVQWLLSVRSKVLDVRKPSILIDTMSIAGKEMELKPSEHTVIGR